MLVFSLALGAHASTLTLTGTCGGPVILDISGLTPGGAWAVVSAAGEGSAVVPGGPCAGLELGLDASFKLRRTGRADGSGAARLTPILPVETCGHHVQVVDVSTCTASNTARIEADADQDGFDTSVDCDDDDDSVYPGALEVCDGVKNDCNDGAWVDDDGVVTWFGDEGNTEDLTTAFAAGGTQQLAWPALDDAGGELMICPGTYAVRIHVETSMGYVAITGLEGAGATTLSPTGGTAIQYRNRGPARVEGLTLALPSSGRGIDIAPQDDVSLNVSIQDVDLVNASLLVSDGALNWGGPVTLRDITSTSPAGFPGSVSLNLSMHSSTVTLDQIHLSGGGLSVWGFYGPSTQVTLDGFSCVDCEGGNAGLLFSQAEAVVSDVSMSGGSLEGLYVESSIVELTDFAIEGMDRAGVWVGGSSTLTATDGVVRGNTATQGAGVTAYGAATLTRVQIDTNVATGATPRGAGLYVGGLATVQLVDALVADNQAEVGGLGGGAWVSQGGSLTCEKVGLASAGFLRNTAGTDGGAVYLAHTPGGQPSNLTSTGCDWGTGADDNLPVDITLEDGPQSYVYGDDADFGCAVGDGGSSCG